MDMEEGAQPTAAQANVVVQATVVRATVETAAAQTVASVAAVDKMTMSAEVQAPAAEEAPRSAEEGGRSAKRSRPRGPTPVWGKTEPSWDGVAWVDESGNQRPKDQRSREKNARRRTPEAQVANAAAERKRKARKKEEALLKEEEQKLEQQVLPGAEAPACAAEGPQLPGAAVHEDMLTRKKGYDTTNNLNKLLTQGFSCSIPDRNKKKLFSTLIMKINALEEHDLMSKYQAVMVATETMGDVSVVDVLRLVRKELECKEPHAKRHDYSVKFRKQLKDVLLATLGKDTVLAMQKEVVTKLEPEADGLSIEESLRNENEALKKEALMKDLQLESLQQQIAQLVREKEAITLQTQMIANLSELSGSEFNLSHMSAWTCPPRTPSVKSEGAKTAAYGLDDDARLDEVWGALSSEVEDPAKGSWM